MHPKNLLIAVTATQEYNLLIPFAAFSQVMTCRVKIQGNLASASAIVTPILHVEYLPRRIFC